MSTTVARRGVTDTDRDSALDAVAAHTGAPRDALRLLGTSNAVTVLVPGDTPCVVRAHRRSSAWACATYAALRHALACGAPVLEPLGTLPGFCDGWTLERYRYVPLDRSVQHDPYAHGAMLAELHLATAAEFAPTGVGAQRRARIPDAPFDLPEPWASAASAARDWLVGAYRASVRHRGCVVHAEAGFANLWITASGEHLLVDFDHAGWGELMWDLAHAIGDRRLVSRDPGDWAALMEGYLAAGGVVDGARLAGLLPLRAAVGALDAASRWHLGAEHQERARHRLETWTDPEPRWEPLGPPPVPPV